MTSFSTRKSEMILIDFFKTRISLGLILFKFDYRRVKWNSRVIEKNKKWPVIKSDWKPKFLLIHHFPIKFDGH